MATFQEITNDDVDHITDAVIVSIDGDKVVLDWPDYEHGAWKASSSSLSVPDALAEAAVIAGKFNIRRVVVLLGQNAGWDDSWGTLKGLAT